MTRFHFHYAELFLLSNTIIGALIPLFGPLTVSFRVNLWESWTIISVITPLTVMNILIALSWPLLIVLSVTRFSEAHSEQIVRLGLRRLLYFFLLVAAILLFWPILTRALPDLLGSTLDGYILRLEGGLIRPSAGVTICLIYFFYILIANITVWSFRHLRKLRVAYRP